MKRSFILLFLLVTALSGFSQEVLVSEIEETKTPEDWRERFFELTKEERLALFSNPDIEIRELYDFIEANRENYQENVRGGGDDIFGCEMWYTHNPLELTQLDGTNWEVFGGGCGAGQGVDAYYGPIEMPFDFCFFGTPFNFFYINTKGTISFNEPMCDWTPEDFPAAGYDIIAGHWADYDFTGVGLCYWEVTDEGAIVTFLDVGHWAGGTACRNTMQMVLTEGNGGLLADGYNVGLFYQNMDWAHGDVGGQQCEGGPDPSIVGADKASGTDHIKIGRFNDLTAEYNGPYGEPGGINWLDNKNFMLMLCEDDGTAIENHPPIATNHNSMINGEWPGLACDTATVCLGDTLNFCLDWLAPEDNQLVQILVDDSDAGDALEITVEENGETARLCGYWIGAVENVGTHSFTVTVSDNGTPVASIEQTFFVEVLNQEAPDIFVIGETTICQGQPAELTVEPGDLDYYVWSTGCAGVDPECLVGLGGDHTVTAYDGACAVTTSFSVDVISFTLPQLSFDPPPPICFGESIEVCIEDEFVSYGFEEFEDYPFNPVSTDLDQQCVDLGPGYYVAVGQDENGCEARNIFNIATADAELPAEFEEAICGSLEPFEFTGGFANPGGGNLLIYISDADCDFAEGSFMQVTIFPEDGSEEYTIPVSMTEDCFWANNSSQQIEIEYGDSIIVEYFASGDDNGNNMVTLFNCSNSNIVYNEAPQGSGILWQGVAECDIEPATGTWTQTSCPCDGEFSNSGVYDNTFTPCTYGTYELTFAEDNCQLESTYILHYTEAPEDVELFPGSVDPICSGQEINFVLDYDVPSECDVDISWSNATPSGDDTEATYSHAGSYEAVDVVATVSNACGSASATVPVQSSVPPTALIDDLTLCDGGSATLDPENNDTPDLSYNWTQNGNAYSTDNEITITQSGLYCVEIENECGSADDCANVIIASPWTTDWDGDTILECEDDQVVLDVDLPPGYTSVPNVDEIVVDGYGSETVSILVTDPEGCDTYESSATVIIQNTEGIEVSPSTSDTIYVCPNEIETLDLNFGSCDDGDYSWTLICPGYPVETLSETGSVLELSSDAFVICLDTLVQITGASNPGATCCDYSVTWEVLASLCEVNTYNVFSPNNDNMNDRFVIEGIERFDRTEVFIYDRWGVLVFHEENYRAQNAWTGDDVPEGTYFYIAKMYDSTDTVIREIESHLTLFR